MAEPRNVNLALQGGGSHGAYTWGILDRLLEDDRFGVEAVSATSAGAVNAVVMAQGAMVDGRQGARRALRAFWWDCALSGAFLNPVRRLPWEQMGGPFADPPASYVFFDALTRMLSPYQFNPFDFNPLRNLLLQHVDFDRLRKNGKFKIFLNATNVRTGEVKVFEPGQVSIDAVMASACLPFLFRAVDVDGEHYWDGGYMGNPSLWPLFDGSTSRDIIVVHINPMEQPDLPTSAHEIADRINEISFNGSLIAELRAIAFMQKLIENEWLTGEGKKKYKYIHIHSIRADKALAGLGVATKLTSDWTFLQELFEKGRETASAWLEEHGDMVGKGSSCDVRREYLRGRARNAAA